jgi:hypothetical protein
MKGTEECPIINLPETIGNIPLANLLNNESTTLTKHHTTFSLLVVTGWMGPQKGTDTTM